MFYIQKLKERESGQRNQGESRELVARDLGETDVLQSMCEAREGSGEFQNSNWSLGINISLLSIESNALDATMAKAVGAQSGADEQKSALGLSHLRVNLGSLNGELPKGDVDFHYNVLGVDCQ